MSELNITMTLSVLNSVWRCSLNGFQHLRVRRHESKCAKGVIYQQRQDYDRIKCQEY